MTTQKQIFQFRVALDGITPEVWREIQVPRSYSFWDLHVAIQDAMGWEDYHLHQFRVANPTTGQPELIGIPDDDPFEGDTLILPGWDVPIAPYFTVQEAAAAYEYDLGDGWEHTIVFQEIVPRVPRRKYPRCLAGARACPPEDCGGIHGYEHLLEVLADPDHEEHESMLEWVGGSYEPGAFDAHAVRFDDPRKRWRRAFAEESRHGA